MLTYFMPRKSSICCSAIADAVDRAELDGELNAPDAAAAREQLRIRGLLASSLKEVARESEGGVQGFKKIKPKSLQIFSRQFATMIEAGLNVVASLVILEEQTDDK